MVVQRTAKLARAAGRPAVSPPPCRASSLVTADDASLITGLARWAMGRGGGRKPPWGSRRRGRRVVVSRQSVWRSSPFVSPFAGVQYVYSIPFPPIRRWLLAVVIVIAASVDPFRESFAHPPTGSTHSLAPFLFLTWFFILPSGRPLGVPSNFAESRQIAGLSSPPRPKRSPRRNRGRMRRHSAKSTIPFLRRQVAQLPANRGVLGVSGCCCCCCCCQKALVWFSVPSMCAAVRTGREMTTDALPPTTSIARSRRTQDR
ncbi:hypothetical protein LZ30DRAFT_409528 [Colletotrichum cereale]|nr:hypothetical protein LZ30DRAFT_409528 [Colletotrichum cereale]